MDKKYEGGILDVLAELVQRDLVYRQKKPVHWCTNDRTALAEADSEYGKKTDSSIYVLFQIYDPHNHPKLPREWTKLGLDPHGVERLGIELMIWTTTPWTLPANR